MSVVQVKDDLSGAPGKRVITARKPFDKSYFSTREVEIMEALAFMFDEINGEHMSDLSHLAPSLPEREGRLQRNPL